MYKVETRYKVCEQCKKKYACDKRWGKARSERSKTCSKKCQIKWVVKNRAPRQKKRSQFNVPIEGSKVKRKEAVASQAVPFAEFKNRLNAFTARRRALANYKDEAVEK